MVGGVLLLTVADLWRVDARPAHYHPKTEAAEAFRPSPAVEFLKRDTEPYRILPLTGGGVQNNLYAYFRIPSILGYHPAKLKIYQDLIDEQGTVGILKSLNQGNFNVVNMLNMKYVVADQEINVPPLEPVFREGPYVMVNRAVLPRAWFVDRARVVADPKQHLAAVGNPSWDPHAEALLFEDPGSLDPGTGGTARITRYEPRRVEAEVTSPGNSLLVLSEVHYAPGWKAWLDGAPVPMLRANYVLRAVRVPPGTHTLRMFYDAPTFHYGALVSLGTYALVLIGLAVSFLRGRRRKGEPVAPA
jgi:hypothetical protein